MKVIVYLVLLIVFFLYLGHTEISFSPFRIKIIEWYKPLGIIIMTVGFLFIQSEMKENHLKMIGLRQKMK